MAVDDQGVVIGWVAASPVSDRCVYAGVVEVSVYVDPAQSGRGVGRAQIGRPDGGRKDALLLEHRSGVVG